MRAYGLTPMLRERSFMLGARATLVVGVLGLLVGCSNSQDFTPRAKTASYDAETGSIEFAYPCPDWSHPTVGNTDNSSHSNFGCATTNNLAQQLAYPEDLAHGTGDASADTESTVRTIQRYRAGEIPEPLVPLQSAGGE